MPLRRNDTAEVEITAFAPGAGPPENRIATLRKPCVATLGAESVVVIWNLSFEYLIGNFISSK